MNPTPVKPEAAAGEPSELQRLIADSVEGLFADLIDAEHLAAFEAGDHDPELWQRVAEQGLPAALVGESAGGSGARWSEIGPLLRAIGYWQAPLPLAESMLAGALLDRAGLALPDGPLTIAETGRHGELRLCPDSQRLNGVLARVPWARDCRWLVVSSLDRQLALVDLRQAAIRLDRGSNFAAEPLDRLHFEGAEIAALAPQPLGEIDAPLWTLGALARACMLWGALEATLDKTVEYANQRVQFGKPIGRQQALQQYLAQLAGAIGAARMACQVALDSADAAFAGEPGGAHRLRFDVAVAKVCAGEAATLACSVAHQVFGAIGFTREHSLHQATRRLWSWRDEFGSDSQWALQLGEAAIDAGSAGFWNGLCERSL
ncbi:acyl-CoA dehydrogenase family protein [Pseudomonas sp. PSE14]|uniref:acyl-CoA dehydrogenase family protein n=1 Tax=Pseudomonas sp. PSE14 TaxID=3016341 RepID=UPI0023D85D68|nr:acyl-CoA dehydrogenase family protein [Pseudomonas sp. PSE14]WEJ69748.1 acyl-CoA/acyl-ACP dehydrogenase [Pseudomonas sp. PSE14]